jgi:hypothetical protein
MRRSNLQSSWFRNALKVALLAAAVGLSLTPSDASACARFCPLYLVQSCVMARDGRIFTTETNPCLACKAGLRYLYKGACQFWWGPPITCQGGSCLTK